MFLKSVISTVSYYCTRASEFRPVSHVIFDIDGLLLKTEDIYEKADSAVIAKYGKSYPMDLRLRVLGRTEQAAANAIVSELKLPISDVQYRKEVAELLDDMLKEAPLMDGAERLVRHLSENKVPIAVATSSGERGVKAKTTNHRDLFKLFSHIVMGSSDPEVKHGKPEPDIFLLCAKRFPDQPNPSKCLVFEDAPNGVQAALKANMQVVLVPESYIGEEDRKKATLVLNSLNDFKPELFGLPPFPR